MTDKIHTATEHRPESSVGTALRDAVAKALLDAGIQEGDEYATDSGYHKGKWYVRVIQRKGSD